MNLGKNYEAFLRNVFMKTNSDLCLWSKLDGLVKSHKSDGTVKSSRCKARESLGMRRTYQYAAVTKNEAQRRPSALLRAVSMSNGRWTFYEAVKLG